MPFVRDLTGEESEDFDMQRTSGGLEYVHPSDYRYENVKDKIEGAALVMLEALRSLGATEFRVNYDGGCDEGFAHPDSIRIDGELRPAEDIIDQLVTPEILAKLNADSGKPRVFFNGKMSDRQIVAFALEELADEFTSRLLGRGFGTGEHTLYGAFSADLATLDIDDDPNANPPQSGNY